MVVLSDGRFSLPDYMYYTPNQHVYLDPQKRTIGIDEIGYQFLKNPTELTLLVNNTVKVGETFASITTERGITTLISPCSGKIKHINRDALQYMQYETYTKGYIIELEEITELYPSLISGADILDWGQQEAKSLIRNQYSFKIIEIGDTGVGKTALKVRFVDSYFKKDLITTLGVDFGSKEIKAEYLSGDILFSGRYRFTAKLNIWDAAGQEAYEKIRPIYYREAKGAIIVYDVNNHRSFENLDLWVKELEECLGIHVPVLLIGNKSDLERKVARHEGLDYAMKYGFLFVECSAKSGENVEDAFVKLAIEIFKREEGLA